MQTRIRLSAIILVSVLATVAFAQTEKAIPFTVGDKIIYLFTTQKGHDTTMLSVNDTIVFNQNIQAQGLSLNKTVGKSLIKKLTLRFDPTLSMSDKILDSLWNQVDLSIKRYEDKKKLAGHWNIQESYYEKMQQSIEYIQHIEDTLTQIRKKIKVIEFQFSEFSKQLSDSLQQVISTKGSITRQQLSDIKTLKTKAPDYAKQRSKFYKSVKADSVKFIKRISIVESNTQIMDSLILKQKTLRLTKKGLIREIGEIKKRYAIPELTLTGNALTLFKNDNSKNQQTTTGIGISVDKADLYEFDMQMTLSQSQDTIQGTAQEIRSFGSSLLVPGIRRYSLLTSYRKYSLWPYASTYGLRNIGAGFSINVTPMIWQKDSIVSTTQSPLVQHVVPCSADFFLSINWINSKRTDQREKSLRISTDIGFTNRIIFGDAGQNEQSRNFFLGRNQRIYSGIYLGINVRIDDLILYFNGPILFGPAVQGLTQGQTIANIGIKGHLLKFNKD